MADTSSFDGMSADQLATDSSPPSHPLRVLISAESFLPAMNGVTNSVLRVVNHLDSCGHIVRVVAPGPGPSTVLLESGRRVVVERVRGVRVPRYRTLTFGIAAVSRIQRSITDFQPDVVHLAAPVLLGQRVGRVARQLGVPSVALFQTDLSGFVTDYGFRMVARPIWGWLRRIHNRADLTLAPTATVASELRDLSFERVGIWGRGVDHVQFNPTRHSTSFRAEVGAAHNTILVGYVGRLASEKRVDRLRALSGIPNVKLVVVGDGPERTRLQSQLPDAHFAGFRSGEALGEAMASLDVFVHTGEHETFCQTIQEAMACSVPVVAPASGGPLDLIAEGSTGFLYEPGDADAFRAVVERLARDERLRLAVGQAGLEAVADRSWGAVGDELLSQYDLVLNPDRVPV